MRRPVTKRPPPRSRPSAPAMARPVTKRPPPPSSFASGKPRMPKMTPEEVENRRRGMEMEYQRGKAKPVPLPGTIPRPQRNTRGLGKPRMPRFEKGGAVYEVNGQRVTKEQYEQASKKTDKAYERAGAEMDSQKLDDSLEAFGKKAKERNKLVPINKNMGGGVKKKPPGLYANIHAKRKRIASGSKEKMRKVGSKGAPTKAAFIKSAKTAKKG